MDFYVYIHRKKTNGEVFYVGKGSGKRAWHSFGRNTLWKRTSEKYGWSVEIVESGLQGWYAFELEKDLIAFYGRRDLGQGTLTNLSDGGDGASGMNPETVKRISESLSGLNCYKADRNIYHFHNFTTKGDFHGTRVDFENQYNLDISGLFSQKRKGLSSHFGWVVVEHLPKNTDLQKLEAKTVDGINNPNADTCAYTFLHLDSGRTFKGTRVEAKRELKINTNSLFFTGMTNKGWIVVDGKTEEDIRLLKDPREIGTEKRRCKIVYNFENKDGTTFSGTRTDFQNTHGFSPYHLLHSNPSMVQKNWFLAENREEVFKSRKSQTIHTFIHEEHGRLMCSREHLELTYSLDSRPLFTGNENLLKTCKGWYLAPKEIQEFP